MIDDQISHDGNKMEKYLFRASATDFKKIPGSPIAYWTNQVLTRAFSTGTLLKEIADPRKGLATTDNNRFLRFWHEVSLTTFGVFFKNRDDAKNSQKKWFPLNKGGEFRKWYGNNDYVINWKSDGDDIKTAVVQRYNGGSYTKEIRSEDKYFQDGITWSALTASKSSFRFTNYGALFDSAGSSMVPTERPECLLSLLNSPIVINILIAINPTLNYGAGTIANIPIILPLSNNPDKNTIELIKISEIDWTSQETSWQFTSLAFLPFDHQHQQLSLAYHALRAKWRETTLDMQRLEEENNRIFIKAYGLQDELTPDVPLNEITLTCNPHYRYRGDKTEDELEALLLADTMREFISYAVGCMFGRYSLDKPGLVLANQGETLTDYLTQIPSPSFTPDDDNVIPILDGEWFADDITERFRQFLRITFGDEHYDDNLHFIEKAIGRDIRRFFLRDFYNDHVKRYKKRPIYWLFSSPQSTFNALIYMHRYQPHTAGTVLSYLRDFRKKLDTHLQHLEKVSISTDASQGEKTRALKDIDKLRKQILELDDYERDTLYPLATQQIAIDLDDGVKTNYPKFGSALKRIVGLEAKDDD